MSLERLALLLFCIVAGIGVAIWMASVLFASAAFSPVLGLVVLGFLAAVAYIVVRVIGDRVGNTEDDHYDGMKH